MGGDQNIMHHPYYSCTTDIAAADNIWVLPDAAPWWHAALWKLGRNVDASSAAVLDDVADESQGDLRWRLHSPFTDPIPDIIDRDTVHCWQVLEVVHVL